MPTLKDLLNVRKGGLLDQWSGYAPSTPDRSVMDAPRPVKSLLPDPADDAIGPPTVLGGLLSLDPTDYVGPGTIGKLAAALKGLGGAGMLPAIGGVVRGGRMADALNVIHGDKIDADLMEGTNVILSRLIAKNKNSGDGTAFMRDLSRLADEQGRTVALSPASDFGGNKRRLEEFYRRFGFVPNKGRNKDFTISESMLREPK